MTSRKTKKESEKKVQQPVAQLRKSQKNIRKQKVSEIFKKTVNLAEKMLKQKKTFSYLPCQPLLTIFFSKRALDLVKASDCLLNNGFINEAIPILRTLFELKTTLFFIVKDKNLADRFVEYLEIQRKKDLNKALEILKIIERTEAEKLKNEIDKNIADLSHEFKSDRWWFPEGNLEKACKELGWENEYHCIYNELSKYCHNTPISLKYYDQFKDKKGNLIWNEKIPKEQSNIHILLAAGILNMIFQQCAKYFEMSSELERLTKLKSMLDEPS